jgi:hypothetical protein
MVLVFLFPFPVLRDMGSFSSPCGVPTQAKFLFLGLREHSSVSRFYSAAMNFFWVYRGSQCWSTLRLNFSCARCSDQTPSRDFVWPTGSCCRIDFLSLLVASLDFCFQTVRSSRCPFCFSSRSGSCALGGSSWLHLSVQCSCAPVTFFCCWFSIAGKVSPPSSQLHRTESFFLPMFLLIARESIEVASLVSGQGSIFFGVYTIRLVASAPAWIRERVPPQSRWLSSLA